MNKLLRIVLCAMLMSVPVANATEKFTELEHVENKRLLSSVALSISHFEKATSQAYSELTIYEQLYTDSNGMLNYSGGVGELVQTNGLIIVLSTKDKSFVYYNGLYAYSVDNDEEFYADLKERNIGTQLYAISNYAGISI